MKCECGKEYVLDVGKARRVIQDELIGGIIPCKNPKALTVDEMKNALKLFEVKVVQALSNNLKDVLKLKENDNDREPQE